MKTWVKAGVFILFMGMVVLPVAAVVLSIQKTPQVTRQIELSFDRVKQVKALVDKIRPARRKKQQSRTVEVNEQELNLLVSYAMSHGLRKDTAYSRIRLQDNIILADITIVLPSTPLGEYINISVEIKSTGSWIDIESLQIGRLLIPGRVISPVLSVIHHYLLKKDEYQSLVLNVHSIQQILIEHNYLKVVYNWDPASLARLEESSKPFLLPLDHQQRLVDYYNGLAEVLKPFNRKKISLAQVLAPMFRQSLARSKISNSPEKENTALLQVLALYVTGTDPTHFVHKDLQKKIVRPAKSILVLAGRTDLPKHFLVSAGLSVSAGSNLANFIGLSKEVDDSDGGSGFSFADLAADRAGVKLGSLAISSAQTAKRLQTKMSSIRNEAEFMPAIDQLPEGIMELVFKRDYKDLDSKTYSLVNDEIDKRVNQCVVYH